MSRSLPTAVLVVVVLSVCLPQVRCQRYIVPEATLELLSPRGLKISIPDIDDGVSLVAFHININKEFESLEHGDFAKDIVKKREGLWSYYIPDFKVKTGDIIYYWIYVIVDNLGYHGLDRVYRVSQDVLGGSGGTTPMVTDAPEKFSTETSCHPSVTSHNGGLSACRGQVLLSKRFNNLRGWSHEVFIGGTKQGSTALDDEFTVFTQDSDVSRVEGGKLLIKPIPLEEKYGSAFVNSGHLILKGCTSTIPEQCSKKAISYLILPPIMSARLTTKNKFSFLYGIVEIKAKLPVGAWIVPELWLEPKSPSYKERSGRVVLGLSRGNMDVSYADSNWLLEAGVLVDSVKYFTKKIHAKPWSQDFHTFKLLWTQDLMEFSVDNEIISRLPSGNGVLVPSLNRNRLTPFDKEFYITLGVHVAGGRDFSDATQGKPWNNTDTKRFVRFWQNKNKWYPTWNQESALQVESVKVTAL